MFENLAQLAQSERLEQAREDRLDQAEDLCSQGAVLLGLAEADGYAHRELVLQGCHLMMDAIQLARRFIDPYLHLAHVFLAFHDDAQALKYLKAAQEIEPANADVALYLAFLQDPQGRDGQDVDSVDAATAAGTPGDDLDLDALESWLHQQIRGWMQSDLVRPMLEPEPLAAGCQRLAEALAEYQQRLQALDGEIEIAPLLLKLRPLELLLMRARRELAALRQLARLDQDLDRLETELGVLRTQMGQDDRSEAGIQAAFEAVFDHCDRLADALDALEGQARALVPRTARYETLVARIQDLQDG